MHYRISGTSMEPNFKEGSLVWAWPVRKLRVGDVVVLKDPRDSSRIIIKRIAGINNGQMNLQGDNPDRSTDSRDFGSVDKSQAMGRVVFKYPRSLGEWLKYLTVFFALGGSIDTIYLTFKHFEGGEVSCGVLPGADCDLVLGSAYAEFFGIPVALIGALYYLTVLVLAVTYLKTNRTQVVSLILALTAAGFLVSLYLVYLQVFVLVALCAFCIISALISTILFSLAIGLVSLSRKGRL